MTVSLTLTFADLAQAEQAIAAIRAKGISTIPAGSHGGSVCQHDQSGATASAIAGQGAVEGPEGGPTGQDAPAADPVTVASVAVLNTKSPASFCVQATAPLPSTSSPKAGATNLAGRDSGNPDSAILTAPAELSPAIAARQAGPKQPKIQKDEEDRAATISQRERKPLKPHCLRPEMCGGYGRKHCGPCERAAGAQAA